jgi:hypothetical protein
MSVSYCVENYCVIANKVLGIAEQIEGELDIYSHDGRRP